MPWWNPRYGEGDNSFTVDSIATNECPVALITPESRRLVDTLTRADFAHQASGAALHGPRITDWPARMVDAQVVIQQERNRTENARIAKEIEDSKRSR